MLLSPCCVFTHVNVSAWRGSGLTTHDSWLINNSNNRIKNKLQALLHYLSVFSIYSDMLRYFLLQTTAGASALRRSAEAARAMRNRAFMRTDRIEENCKLQCSWDHLSQPIWQPNRFINCFPQSMLSSQCDYWNCPAVLLLNTLGLLIHLDYLEKKQWLLSGPQNAAAERRR